MMGLVRSPAGFRFLRRLRADESGMAAAEIALVLPVFVLLLVGVYDLGSAIHYSMRVQTAAYAGTSYAIARGYNASGISSAVLNATNAPGITIVAGPTQYCGCPSAGGVSAAGCGTSCPDGSVSGRYVSVTARGTYTTLFDYPFIPAQFTFTEQATTRIQ